MLPTPSKSGILLYAVCTLFAPGCDPVRTTSQPVQLRVVDSISGQPVTGAEVRLKHDFDRETHVYPDTAPPEVWHQHMRESWEQFPWFSGVTDKEGRASIDARYTVLDRSSGSKPPTSRDWVTGKPFLVNVKKGQGPEEELSVLMKPGEFAKGKSVSVTVLEIREPKYVPTH